MRIETRTTSKKNKEQVGEMAQITRSILSPKQVVERTGLSRVTLWRMGKKGEFPQRVQISEGRVGWYSDEVDEFIESRPRVVVGELE
jgi:prophage regulatory protein